MAAPGSLPAKAGVARRRRPFTVAEANRALTLVRRITQDIVAAYGAYTGRLASVDAASPVERTTARHLHRDEIEDARSRLDGYIAELQSVGLELDDPEQGIVHFPARHKGRDICLCWRMGEDSVMYWHELHENFASRKPVSMLVDDEPPPAGGRQ